MKCGLKQHYTETLLSVDCCPLSIKYENII